MQDTFACARTLYTRFPIVARLAFRSSARECKGILHTNTHSFKRARNDRVSCIRRITSSGDFVLWGYCSVGTTGGYHHILNLGWMWKNIDCKMSAGKNSRLNFLIVKAVVHGYRMKCANIYLYYPLKPSPTKSPTKDFQFLQRSPEHQDEASCNAMYFLR